MNEVIAEILKSYLSTLNFVDQLGGLVKIAEIKQSDKTVKRVPVDYSLSQHQTDINNHQAYMPDSKKRSVIYFEDKGIETVRHTSRYIDMVSTLKLVAWFNLERIDKDLNNCTQLMFLLAQNIPKSFANQYNILKARTKLIGLDIKNKNIFSDYDYDEAEMQLLMYPYDYGDINYNIFFSINPSCVDDVVINKQDCLTETNCS